MSEGSARTGPSLRQGDPGALIALQKGCISPQGSFNITEFAVYVIFIVMSGGIGSLEGPLTGTIVFFLLRQALANLGTAYLIILGAVSILVILFEPRGIWGILKSRISKADVFPVTRASPDFETQPLKGRKSLFEP